MRACLIVNPCAGTARSRRRLLPRLRAFARDGGLDGELVVTERAGHATLLARRAVDAGCGLVVAVGGDGTVNEVARALVGTGAVLGLVPSGSGNGLARDLGIRGTGADTLRTLVRGRPRAIDTGRAAGHLFVNVAGVGLDAEVGRRVNGRTRRGLPAYLVEGARTLLAYRAQPYVIERDGGAPLHLRALVIAVANSEQYGNQARVAPGARVDDGRLDLVAVTTLTPRSVLPLAVRLFTGSFDRGPGVRRLLGSRFVIRRAGRGPLHTDGEVHDAGPDIEVTVEPASLRVMAP